MKISWHEEVSFGLHFDQCATVGDTMFGQDLTSPRPLMPGLAAFR